MKLRFLGGRFQGRVVDIPGDSFTIGRGQRNDLALDQDGISRYHCKLSRENGSWYIEDLESTNGVRLNGNRITGKQPIRSGNRIGIPGNLLLFSEKGLDNEGEGLSDSLKNIEHSRHAVSLDSDAKTQPEMLADEPAAQAEEAEQDVEYAPSPFPWGRVIALALVLLVFLALGVDHVRRRMSDEQSDATAVMELDGEDANDGLWTGEPEEAPFSRTDAGNAVDHPSDATTIAELEGEDADDGLWSEVPEDVPAGATDAANAVDRLSDDGSAEQAGASSAPWYAVLRSEPSGATAIVDDEEVGATPLVVKLKPGRHRLRLKMAGYEDLQRLIDNGILKPGKPFEMRQNPGTLMVETVPSGASVLHGRQLLGSTPLLITSLPMGKHPLTLKKHGYETHEMVVQVSEIQGIEKTVELVSRLGMLEVVSFPPGCTVRLDGVRKGITQPAPEGLESVPLVIPNLLDGNHELTVAHRLAGDRTGTVRVRVGEVLLQRVRFWIPDHQIKLKNGKQISGMLLPGDEQEEVVLLDRAWKRHRFAADAVKKVVKLAPAKVREILENRNDAPVGLEAGTNAGEVTDTELPAPDFQLDAEAFDQEIRQTAVGDLLDQFENKIVRARGVSRKIIVADGVAHVWLGDSIHCRLDADLLPVIRAAKEADKPLLLQGAVEKCTAEEIVLGDCVIVPEQL